MKKLNKKGFTLIELLAVIVLLAIVGVAGATAISRMLNNSKKTNFVTAYNNVLEAIESQMVVGTVTTGSAVASDYDLSDSDYDLKITNETCGTTDPVACYKIVLTGKGTYDNLALDKTSCAKARGKKGVNGAEFTCGKVSTYNGSSATPDNQIVGYVEK